MKRNQRIWTALVVCIAFTVGAAVSANATRNFVKISLPKGVSIELPRNWVMICNDQRITLDSAVEAGLDLAGMEQGSSNLPFAANYYDNKGRTVGIVNSRYYPDSGFTQDDARQATVQDVNELDVAIKKNMLESMKVFGISILSWNGTKKVTINGITAFITEYRRKSLKSAGAFRVRIIRVLAAKRSFNLTVSYLESKALFFQPITDRIINSIKLTDIDIPRIGNEKTGRALSNGSSIMSKLYGENWALVLFIWALLTWVIGLTPPLLIRYAFLRRSMSKGWTICTVGLFWFINIALFTDLGCINKAHGAFFLVAWASYAILRKDTKKQIVPPETSIEDS